MDYIFLLDHILTCALKFDIGKNYFLVKYLRCLHSREKKLIFPSVKSRRKFPLVLDRSGEYPYVS